jgi:CubicO group peptidase (beta-lactamase class C family)
MLKCLLPALLLWLGIDQAAAQQLDPAAVRAAAKYSSRHHGTSFLAIQNGKTLLEEYPAGGNANTSRRIYSGTKAFWNLAALAAAQDGLLNLDERVADTIPAWRNDPRKSRVTIRQLLDFSCGLAPAFFLQEYEVGDRDAVAVKLPIVAEPGTGFIYGPGALQVFHHVLKNKLHGKAPKTFLERRVLRRLGLGPQRYLEDRAGNPLLATGWHLSARQWAKLGQLVIARGKPVISSSSIAECWRGSPANSVFALGWWNNRAAPTGDEIDFESMLNRQWLRQNWNGASLCRDAPNDLVACIGSGYQRLYVIPSMQLVVVRHGSGGSFFDAKFLRLLLGRGESVNR